MKIGIVGLGYVGSAIYSSFISQFKVFTYDIEKKSNCKSLNELTEKSDIIFVCLPTPMKLNGECDISLVQSTVRLINQISKNPKLVVIKSTVKPGFTNELQSECQKINIIFNPEFLREKSFEADFKNQKFIVLGGEYEDCCKIKEIYSTIFPKIEYFIANSKTAEMVKYTINSFLAMKVSFANEIFQFCKKLDIDYQEMIQICKNDIRLGNSHFEVPGPDGRFGFGGSCFPKDISALLFEMNKMDLSSYIIKAVLERNVDIDRPEKDWERLKGRAVNLNSENK